MRVSVRSVTQTRRRKALWKLTELWKNQRTVFPQLLEPSVHTFHNAGCCGNFKHNFSCTPPQPSRSGNSRPSMSTEWTNLRETEATVEVGLASSTRSAGKPRTGGKQRGRLSGWSRETFPARSEVGEECPHNWTRSRRRQSQIRSCASHRWRICSHRSSSRKPGSR
jgi:hypothetical protein